MDGENGCLGASVGDGRPAAGKPRGVCGVRGVWGVWGEPALVGEGTWAGLVAGFLVSVDVVRLPG